jgi:hypothetical protein
MRNGYRDCDYRRRRLIRIGKLPMRFAAWVHIEGSRGIR